MTTATAAQAAEDTTGLDALISDDGATPQGESTESLLTGQEGEDALDSTEVEAAMLQGFNRATGTKPEDDDTAPSTAKADKQDVVTGEQQQEPPAELDDPEIPGLGLKASEVKASLARLTTLEKTVASANGHIGHLKQMIGQAGKGKAITMESLSKVREEFGDEYASALAADLTAAGIGGGAAVDEETLGAIVNERVAAVRESMEQSMETRLVRARHKDAPDYFAGGKHNAEFAAFIGTLPKERQEELANTWDSSVINDALDSFKAHKAKVVNEQTKQQRRLERSVTPTASRGTPVAQPAGDPIEAGWNNVRGRGRGNAMGARR
jgi:hypothetical protein